MFEDLPVHGKGQSYKSLMASHCLVGIPGETEVGSTHAAIPEVRWCSTPKYRDQSNPIGWIARRVAWFICPLPHKCCRVVKRVSSSWSWVPQGPLRHGAYFIGYIEQGLTPTTMYLYNFPRSVFEHLILSVFYFCHHTFKFFSAQMKEESLLL